MPLVKVMRLFLMNPETGFETKEVAVRAQIKDSSARTELNLLKSAGMVKKKSFTKEQEVKNKKGKSIVKRKVEGWTLDPDFKYLDPLQSLLIGSDRINRDELMKRLKPAGKIKLLVIAGVFIKNTDSRADMMIVGDNLKMKTLSNIIKTLESEIGKELNYAVFSVDEFKYRSNMYDKLVCDIFEFSHEELIKSPDLSTEALKKR
ncbi:MAG: hypothetical protein R3B65_01230 [Candidatus Paceibacterota bacterium]